jgi:hypothetical protein
MEAGTPMSDPDSPEPRVERSGGANFEVQGDVHIHGDVIGRDKMTGGSGGSETPPSLPPQPPSSPPPQPLSSRAEPPDREPWLAFQNREVELDRLLHSLTNLGGTHFYLILAGPQLGKTRLQVELVERLQKLNLTNWSFRSVDLRSEELDVRDDSGKLLSRFFPEVAPDDEELPVKIVERIIQSENIQLCLLDSAELLSESAAVSLRKHLSQIYDYVSQSGKDIWMAFVVASRYEHRAWRGISPAPRFDRLVLSNFSAEVVGRALRDKVGPSQNFPPPWYRENAARLYRVTEGLPALLVKCIEWLKQHNFVQPQRIEEPKRFDELARPYVREVILTEENLLRAGGNSLSQKRDALETVLVRLSPYRLFTYKLLEEIVSEDLNLRNLMKEVSWAVDDLWQAIGDTYLMKPVDDPWREMYPAIRRLLFRYKNASEAVQADVHIVADRFYERQLDGMSPAGGKEQSVFVVERLWHQAERLRLCQEADAGRKLQERAADLYDKYIRTDGYRRRELLDYAGKRMMEDAELQETLDRIESGLLEKLLP